MTKGENVKTSNELKQENIVAPQEGVENDHPNLKEQR